LELVLKKRKRANVRGMARALDKGLFAAEKGGIPDMICCFDI
jgi:hypothetical protein